MPARVCLASLALLVTASGIAACSDSLHLDPDPAGASGAGAGAAGGGSPTGGGGGTAPVKCASSADCPAPTAICDTIGEVCVECLEIEHCAFRPSTVCSNGECVCPSEGDSFCAASEALGDARPARCVDLLGSGGDCGTCGHRCFGACAEGKCVDAWEPTPLGDAPSPRARHACASTGTQLLVWGGDGPSGYLGTGAALDVGAGKWVPTSLANAPTPRAYVRGVWTGDRFFVWGGYDGKALGSGALYDPVTNVWQTVSTSGAPSPRYAHAVVWAEGVGRVLVWGGNDGTDDLDSGAQYDPKTGAWSAISTGNAPTRRRDHAVAWTGTHLVVYGGTGFDGTSEGAYLEGGKLFDPEANSWQDLPTEGQPSPRARAEAAFGADRFALFGGEQGGPSPYLGDGATFGAGAWASMAGPPPSPRRLHTAVFVPDPIARVIVFGGDGPNGRLGDGGVFDPAAGAWSSKPIATAPAPRNFHCAAAVGPKMLVWGGETPGFAQTGGVLDPTKL